MFISHGTIFPSDSVTLVSINVWQKSFLVKQTAKSFDICGYKIQNLKVGSVPSACILLIQQKPFMKFAIM